MNKCCAKVVNHPAATKGIFSTLHFKELLKRYAVTGSRCSHCWSVLDKGFAQTQGG
jgi:hypothetical protein